MLATHAANGTQVTVHLTVKQAREIAQRLNAQAATGVAMVRLVVEIEPSSVNPGAGCVKARGATWTPPMPVSGVEMAPLYSQRRDR